MNQHPPIFYNILSHFVYRQRKAVLHSGWPQYVLCTKPNQSATHNKLCSPMPMFYVKYVSIGIVNFVVNVFCTILPILNSYYFIQKSNSLRILYTHACHVQCTYIYCTIQPIYRGTNYPLFIYFLQYTFFLLYLFFPHTKTL